MCFQFWKGLHEDDVKSDFFGLWKFWKRHKEKKVQNQKFQVLIGTVLAAICGYIQRMPQKQKKFGWEIIAALTNQIIPKVQFLQPNAGIHILK